MNNNNCLKKISKIANKIAKGPRLNYFNHSLYRDVCIYFIIFLGFLYIIFVIEDIIMFIFHIWIVYKILYLLNRQNNLTGYLKYYISNNNFIYINIGLFSVMLIILITVLVYISIN